MDLQQYVYGLLRPVGYTVYAHPGQGEQFPVISFYQRDGGSQMMLQGQERLISYHLQVDVWDKSTTPKEVERLTQGVIAAMTAGGFTRYFTADIPDKTGVFHKALRFGCTLDCKTGFLYGMNNDLLRR